MAGIVLRGGDDGHPLIVADGYHRLCARYRIDENNDIPCDAGDVVVGLSS